MILRGEFSQGEEEKSQSHPPWRKKLGINAAPEEAVRRREGRSTAGEGGSVQTVTHALIGLTPGGREKKSHEIRRGGLRKKE